MNFDFFKSWLNRTSSIASVCCMILIIVLIFGCNDNDDTAKDALLTQVSAGYDHVLAFDFNSDLWAMGANEYGQIGDGSTKPRHSFVRVGAKSKWIKAAAGHSFSVGLMNNGTIWFWGLPPMDLNLPYYNYLQVQENPLLLGEDGDWVDVDASRNRITAIKSDGRCFFWEGGGAYIWNHHGIIGDEPNSHWKAVATGNRHVILIKTDGTLWCRSESISIDGYDRFYNLNNWSWFKQIGEETDWVQIDAYEDKGIGLRADGSLYELSFEEDDVKIDQIGYDEDWRTASIGWNCCAAIKDDGSLWTCSGYEQGQEAIFLQQYGNDYDWLSVASGYNFIVAINISGNSFFIGELPLF